MRIRFESALTLGLLTSLLLAQQPTIRLTVCRVASGWDAQGGLVGTSARVSVDGAPERKIGELQPDGECAQADVPAGEVTLRLSAPLRTIGRYRVACDQDCRVNVELGFRGWSVTAEGGTVVRLK